MAKRFYTSVSTEKGKGGYAVKLDARTLKTPGKAALVLPTEALAALIAAEWDAQEDEITPATMPVTRLLNVAIERTPEHRDEIIAEARNYAGSDLLCYRAPTPKDLTARQAKLWDPWLDWAAKRGVKLDVTEGIIAIPQDAASLEKVAEFAAALDNISLTLFVHMTAVFGSAVLAMAVITDELPAGDAFELSKLDEAYQNEAWGVDEDAAARTEGIRRETLALGQILPALKG